MGEVAAVVTSSGEAGGMEVDDGDKKEGSSEVIGWEKLLPRNENRMVLRVLLVEADDSTRQIISALLRKCSYRVAAVPDGLMAWETLRGKPHNIDLILTEVELPSISGYALLTLIMEHEVCKNIPVIMMSSHDSISMVFKCMLKGAADFLIKPVRRNELKNLWHHVWRRQTLTAGSPNSPNAQHKVEAASVSNSASDHSSDCATSSHKSKECSDKGSDAHGSKPECRSLSKLSNREKKKYEEFITLDKSSAIPESNNDWSTRLRSVDLSCDEAYNPTVLKLEEEHAFSKIQDERAKQENGSRNANSLQGYDAEHMGSSRGAIDLIGAFDNSLKHTYRHVNVNDDTNKFECPSQLELSLRRFFPNSSGNEMIEERSVLNHSNASAFSRYSGKILQYECQSRNYDHSGYLSSNQFSENANRISQPLGSNLNDSQETVTTLVTSQSGKTEPAYSNPISEMRLDNICNDHGHGHLISPLRHGQTGLPSWNAKLASQREQSPYPSSTSIHSSHEIQDSEQTSRQSADTTTNSVDQGIMHQRNNMECVEELKHGSPTAAQSTSGSMCNSISDHNNSSGHGNFINKSDGNAAIHATSEKPTVPESSNGGIFMCDKFRGMDSNRSSQREAALMKFRLKRKDRCYEKKVRYQSRKRLAEMRPRVKGQFVRQVQNDASIADTKV